jgi:hypothetical protein
MHPPPSRNDLAAARSLILIPAVCAAWWWFYSQGRHFRELVTEAENALAGNDVERAEPLVGTAAQLSASAGKEEIAKLPGRLKSLQAHL